MAEKIVLDCKQVRLLLLYEFEKQSSARVAKNTDRKTIFKVKSSNNDEYSVEPVFVFIEPTGNASIEVVRLNAAPCNDRMVVQFAPAPNDATDAKEAFGKVEEPMTMFTINLTAT
ncbi:unnamed protein product [Heligmosomoides polygyrus]|uniref:MSP domain-containing protein n=1 Tax=Heligmosomoides polygyrus TaxID=6339 RepID=A0A183FW94_HELPZ|nr:unnamed protein product [Heligmosomoides polygyrus]